MLILWDLFSRVGGGDPKTGVVWNDQECFSPRRRG